ncbi:MAG: BrnT family toxin [Burkholderiales bacterium]|nr:BrnT family toxin [Burkholderiales bacterium]
MPISFDPAKNAANIASRGIPFDLVEQLDWATALIREDTRKAYGERRFQVLGFIGNRLHAVVFTPRDDKVHVISLRKANSREINRYAETSTQAPQSGAN